MEVIVQTDADRAAYLTALLIADKIRNKPDLVLGLATGRTMEQVYAHLARFHKRDGLDFSLCRTFNLDEYVGVPPESAASYRYYMNQHLFSRVNIDPRNTNLPDGMATNLKAACQQYESRIRACGGIDLQLLGIGTAGHIGFNEPLSAMQSRTRDKSLTRATLEQNAPMFGGNPDLVPRRALTMGVGTILEARHLILVATGAQKSEIIAKAVEGPITAMVSASAIQFHADCKVIVDEIAAAGLQGRDYYRWIYENEPDWDPYRALMSAYKPTA